MLVIGIVAGNRAGFCVMDVRGAKFASCDCIVVLVKRAVSVSWVLCG